MALATMQVNSLVSGDVHLDVCVTELYHHWFRQRLVTCSTPVIHYNNVIMSAMTSQITNLTIVYSTVYSGRSKKIPKPCVTGLCVGNSPVTGEFPTWRASNAKNDVIMIWIDADLLPIQIVPIGANSFQFWTQIPTFSKIIWKCLQNVGHSKFRFQR